MKLLALVSIALIFSGCVSVDNRERIAVATLYPDNSPFNPKNPPVHTAPILTSALNSKFPPGTDLESIKAYVTKLNGKCSQSQSDQPVRCSFIEFGTFCVQTSIAITIKTNSLNKIEGIDAFRIIDAC